MALQSSFSDQRQNSRYRVKAESSRDGEGAVAFPVPRVIDEESDCIILGADRYELRASEGVVEEVCSCASPMSVA
jgi:hypothetical protein